MSLYKLTFYCLVKIAPKNSSLEIPAAASILHGLWFSLVLLAMFFWLDFFIRIEITANLFKVIIIPISTVPTIWNWLNYSGNKRFEKLQFKFDSISKKQIRLIGILYLIAGPLILIISGLTLGFLG